MRSFALRSAARRTGGATVQYPRSQRRRASLACMPPHRPARAAAPRAERTTPPRPPAAPSGRAPRPLTTGQAAGAGVGTGRRRARSAPPARPERHRGDVAPGRKSRRAEAPGGATWRPATATSRRRSRRAIGRSRKCYVGRLGKSPPDVFGAAESQVHARSGGLSRRPLRPDLGLRGRPRRRVAQPSPTG